MRAREESYFESGIITDNDLFQLHYSQRNTLFDAFPSFSKWKEIIVC